MSTVITVRNLSKTFTSQGTGEKSVRALFDVSLDVEEGEILGILGPNGAGKTTLLNCLSTLLIPDTGTIEILGVKSVSKNFNRLRRLLNMSSGYPNFPWSLTVEENLMFYGRLYGLDRLTLKRKIHDLIQMFDLGDFARRRFDELSSGNKQKLSLAKALLNDPKIIFLDEPTVGLDPDVSVKTREIILRILKQSRVTVLLTTHNMQEAELMCRRIAFIKQGEILRLASPGELKKMHHSEDLENVFIELARAKPEPAMKFAGKVNQSTETSDIVEFESENVFSAAGGWLNRCLAFSYRNYLFAVRNIFAFMELLFWPIVSLLSVGLMGDYLQLQEKALAFILTGAITAGVLQVTQLDVAYSLLYEVWSKSMKHTLLAPVGVSENLVGSWLVGMARGGIIFIVLGVAAGALFGFSFPPLIVTLVSLGGIFICALLLGLLVSILILVYGQKAEISAWMFAYVFMLLSGIYYPIDTLPKIFYKIAQVIPVTYFLEYFRSGFGFTPQLSHGLLKGFGLVVLYLLIGLVFMHRAFFKARQRGTIVRLSE